MPISICAKQDIMLFNQSIYLTYIFNTKKKRVKLGSFEILGSKYIYLTFQNKFWWGIKNIAAWT